MSDHPRGFLTNEIYELVDFDGLVAHHAVYDIYMQWFPHHIKKSGNVIVPLQTDSQGNAFGVKFGNGVVYTTQLVSSTLRKFFKPVEPVPIEAIMPLTPKAFSVEMKLAEIIKFPRKEKKEDDFWDITPKNVVNSRLVSRMPDFSTSLISKNGGIYPCRSWNSQKAVSACA